MAKSRPRPDAAEAAPPAKRRKAAQDTRAAGFEHVLLNQKVNKKLPTAHITKAKGASEARVNDENVVVNTANGHGDVARKGEQDVVDISSDSESELSSDSDAEVEKEEAVNGEGEQKANGLSNGVHRNEEDEEEDAAPGAEEEVDTMDEDMEDGEEASFGERLHAQQSEPIDVESELAKAEGEASENETREPQRALIKAPSGATFSTVLTQALRTGDKNLLESCYESHDLESVRETLSRMDSRLVVPLMHSMAERISKTPGRLGNLMVWIQWAVIAHGGYLAGQPDVRTRMGALHRVIEARAQGLQPLLQLKGKLDMLAAQHDLRRDEQERNARQEQDEEEAITIYVEGQDDSDSDMESGSEDIDDEQRLMLESLRDGDMSSEEDEVPTGAFANGIVKGDVDASDSDEGDEGFLDDEAEETDEEDSEEEGSDEDDSD